MPAIVTTRPRAEFFPRLDANPHHACFSITLFLHPEIIEMIRSDAASRKVLIEELEHWTELYVARFDADEDGLDPDTPEHRILVVPSRCENDWYENEAMIACDQFGEEQRMQLRGLVTIFMLLEPEHDYAERAREYHGNVMNARNGGRG